jgi:pseudouridine synthase
MPPSPVESLTLAVPELVKRAGLFSRRLQRRATCFVYQPDGTRLSERDRITVTREPQDLVWRKQGFRVWLGPEPIGVLHKPLGYVVSAVEDGGHATAESLLPPLAVARGVHAVGRLDVETSGLLIFTADGSLVQRLTHPRREVPRTYLVGCRQAPEDRLYEALMRGDITLRDGLRPRPTLAQRAEAPGPPLASDQAAALHWSVTTLTEGKYHEVRRMFAAIGHPVEMLLRVGYGPVDLRTLPLETPGEWMWLPPDLHAATYAQAGLPVPAPTLIAEPLGRVRPGAVGDDGGEDGFEDEEDDD